MAAQLEAERKEYETQLELVDASLQDDPENEELLALRTELTNCIQLLNDSLAELQGAAASSAITAQQTQEPLAIGIPSSSTAPRQKAPSVSPLDLPTPATEEPPKWSRENHPAFKKQGQSGVPAQEMGKEDTPPAPASVVNYQVNDSVMARWLSGDKGFYPAKIVSVTGSSTAPIYTVRFKSYDTVETLRAKDIKPVAAPAPSTATSSTSSTTSSTGPGFKRKADFGSDNYPIPSSIPASSAAGAAAITRNSDGITLSAGPELYPGALAAAQAAEEQGKKGGDSKFDKDGKPKFKKIKANKELEKGKNKWQEFTQKASAGKLGKAAKKESMFRTPEGIHGRVGFTGSGQAMRKDPTRARHIYQPNEDLD